MEELLSPFEVVAYKIGMNYAEPFLVQGTATIGDAELDRRRRLCFGDFGLNKLRPGASRTRPCCFAGLAAVSPSQPAADSSLVRESLFFGSEGVVATSSTGT